MKNFTLRPQSGCQVPGPESTTQFSGPGGRFPVFFGEIAGRPAGSVIDAHCQVCQTSSRKRTPLLNDFSTPGGASPLPAGEQDGMWARQVRGGPRERDPTSRRKGRSTSKRSGQDNSNHPRSSTSSENFKIPSSVLRPRT